MPQRMMEQSKIFQLEKLLSYCRQLDFLKIRYDQKNRYFTAIAWCPDRVFPPGRNSGSNPKADTNGIHSFPRTGVLLLRPFQHIGLCGMSKNKGMCAWPLGRPTFLLFFQKIKGGLINGSVF